MTLSALVSGPLGDLDTRVLLAILIIDRPLIPALCLAVGRSRAVVHKALVRLRDAELVTWEPGATGTLRPLVSIVPPDDRSSVARGVVVNLRDARPEPGPASSAAADDAGEC